MIGSGLIFANKINLIFFKEGVTFVALSAVKFSWSIASLTGIVAELARAWVRKCITVHVRWAGLVTVSKPVESGISAFNTISRLSRIAGVTELSTVLTLTDQII